MYFVSLTRVNNEGIEFVEEDVACFETEKEAHEFTSKVIIDKNYKISVNEKI